MTTKDQTKTSQSRVRRLLPNKRSGWIAAVVLACVVGLSGCAAATAPSTTATSSATGAPFKNGGGSNARTGAEPGGSSGTITAVTSSGFTLTTVAGQKVTIKEGSSTTYLNGTTAATSSAVAVGAPALVLGTASGTTITATQVTVQPPATSGSETYTASAVAPFKQGSPSAAQSDGQVPTDYTEGSGTIVTGATANQATEAALAAYPGGIVDRVVQLANGEYEVHYIGVNWPHHIFVNSSFTVVGAD
jgi:hypothetical protein